MPELPDLTIYLEALAARVEGSALRGTALRNPFVLRTAIPPIEALHARRIAGLRRSGKRLVLAFEGDFFLVIHLMIAGRLQWLALGRKAPRHALAEFSFDRGVLVLTEAGSKRRASLHVIHGEAALAALDPGGLEPLMLDAERFAAQLRGVNQTLKRALTDPRRFAGIGNAYSDEILHAARLSPFKLTQQLDDREVSTLYQAMRETLQHWTEVLRREAAGTFPAKVTAFREGMAVHGRFGKPCPACGAPVQRVVYADNQLNYCARCQTGGRLLADRALSQLLHDSFPRRLDDA